MDRLGYSPTYHSVSAETLEEIKPVSHAVRQDDSGVWNFCKAWYIFLLHLITCVALVVGMISIDNHDFTIGSGPSLFSLPKPRLYQTQVTALISLGLVITRLIASSCSALLVWRVIYILLEKSGISLAELVGLTNWRLPVLFRGNNKTSVLWSIWAPATILLLWPQGFAAPIGSSSISWIPTLRVLNQLRSTSITNIPENGTNWESLLYKDQRMKPIIASAFMTSRDPNYVFRSTGLMLRRYFEDSTMPEGSIGDMMMPYFDVDIRWINATDMNFTNIGDVRYQGVNDDFNLRVDGTIAIVSNQTWDVSQAIPKQADTFIGTKIVAVKVPGVYYPEQTGDNVSIDAKCPTASQWFGNLPNVIQHHISFAKEGTESWDCYVVAEATIKAGSYLGNNCTTTKSFNTGDTYATCSIDPNESLMRVDWLANLALDFTSDVLKYTVLQNYSQPWINNNITEYTAGMLTMGFQAAWSGIAQWIGSQNNGTETISYRPTEHVVSASIDQTKLYIWLGLNATLTASAILVCLAQIVSGTKTIRNTAIAALTMDMVAVTGDSRARGLSNAVALNKDDRKLPKMIWKDAAASRDQGVGEKEADPLCRRRVIFMDEHPTEDR
jgi:hypothetical protein